MRYRVLGPVAATTDDTPVRLGGPKQRLVLALLLRSAGRTVADDLFIDALWRDDPPSGARHSIQTYVSGLRGVLDDEIVRDGHGYRLAVDPQVVDAHRFEALVAAGRERLADAPAAAAALLRDALGLWQGEPYADLADTDVLRDEVHRLQLARIEAVEDRFHADLESGRHAHVVGDLAALARDHPYREGLHGLLMLALYRVGRQAEALRAYERLREVLATELGLDPSPDLQRLHRQILAQDPSLELTGVRPGAESPPEVVRGFELRSCIQRHGPLAVWRAYQPNASQEVAVTVVAAHEANASAFVRRFEPHARRIARIHHPHLLAVRDHWRDPRGAYIVTSLAPGGAVRATLAGGPWSPAATFRLVEQVGRALEALHREDLVHGHVGADTVWLDAEGSALLSPVGVVLPGAAAVGAIAPEVRRGEPVEVGADVYGLACLALELLTGSPVPGDAPMRVLDHVQLTLPVDVATVLTHATSDDPRERPVPVSQFVRALRRALGTDVVEPAEGPQDAAGPRNPYKGLRAFDEADAADFHGREALVDELVETVAAHPFVAVVGPSGSGKSSLVRAGLVPELRAQDARGPAAGRVFTDLFPGAHPFEELEAALLRVAVDRSDGLLEELLADAHGLTRVVKQVLPADTELILVIDQFEELYSLATNADLRRLFLDALVTLADDAPHRVRTVVTLRADFFDRPLQHHGLAALVRRGLVAVGTPGPQELARAVAQPARSVGVEFEPGLVDTIVRDVAAQPGTLPLLQYALTELFEQREGHLLTTSSYRATGGVEGALGRRADELYRLLSPRARDACQQVLLRLAAVDEHLEVTRRRVRRADLSTLEADPEAVSEVIHVFGTHRLLSFDRDPVTRSSTVEVAHEALFRAWAPLRTWVEARREDLLLHNRLVTAVTEWHQAEQAPDYLLSGGRLEQFERWADDTQFALNTRERRFLAASREREDARWLRRRRRRRLVSASIIAAAVLAGVLAVVAMVQGQRARTSELLARSRELATASRLEQPGDPDLALLLALEAVEVAPGAGRARQDAVDALHEAVLGHRLVETVDAGGVFVEPAGDEGRLFVSGPPANRAGTWDPSSGEAVAVLRDDGREASGIATSGDGRLAVETFVGQPTLVWDLDGGQLLHELPATTPFQLWPVLSPDGRTLAVANLDDFGRDEQQSISLWDLETGRERLRVPHEGNAQDLAFSPDGQLLAVADRRNAVVRLYDVQTGEVRRVIGDASDPRGVASVAFHPSGQQLAMFVFTPRELRVVDLDTDEVVHRVPMGTAALSGALCYSGDGTTLVVATQDELLEVFDAAGRLRLSLPGSPVVDSLACDHDGERVAMATEDGRLGWWGLRADDVAEVAAIAAPAPFTGVWTADGALLTTHHGSALTAEPDRPVTGTLRRYDATSHRLVGEVDGLHPFPPWWLEVSPDGRYAVSIGNPFGDADPATARSDLPRYARLVVHDAVSLELLGDIEPGGWPLGFGPDPAQLLIGGSGAARVIDVSTGAVVTELTPPATPGGPEPELGAGALLDDGRHAVLVDSSGTHGWVLDRTTGEVTATFCPGGGAHVALGPDGRTMAVATWSASLQLWDLPTLLRTGGAACEQDQQAAGRTQVLDVDATMGLSFGPAGRRVAAAGRDRTVTVYDVAEARRVLEIAHEAEVGGASFSPDGRHVLVTVNHAGGAQHAVRVYTLDPGELVAIARARVTRPLSADECARFLVPSCRPGT